MNPDIRRDGQMIIGREARYFKRWLRPRLGQVWARATCWLLGHRWSPWHLDDYDGPGEELEDGGFMPFCSRESRPEEYGERLCDRHCGTSERRWPIEEAPILWVEEALRKEPPGTDRIAISIALMRRDGRRS